MVDSDVQIGDVSRGSDPSGPPTTETRNGRFSIPLVSGFLVGALTFAVNYVAVYGLYFLELRRIPGEFSIDPIHQYQVAGWLLYGAHRVGIGYWPDGPTSLNLLELVYGAAGLGIPRAFTDSHRIAINLFFGGWQNVEYAMVRGTDGVVMSSMTVPKLAYVALPVITLILGGRRLARRA
ncbi:MAG: hypothetical protein ABEJ55_02035, partial [Halanaeroarchaeum sp.]